MEKRKILVIDDEPDLVELVSYNLRKEGFVVVTSADGEDALEKIRKDRYDLMVLDLMLPSVQGVEVCRMVRNDPRTETLPIIMLTARGEVVDRIRGLETGADDYMTKPFSPRELVARVRALLRRTGETRATAKLRLGEVVIDRETFTVTKRAGQVHLSSTEFKLLLFLAERKGRVFSRDQLLDAVWKDDAFVEPRTVDVHIRRLRMQIEDDPAEPIHIKTRRGVGYYVE
jgi:phosphate regulon transcriptional regulator PhoB